MGNNTDTDDDGDGYLDEDEIACGSDPLRTAGSGRPKIMIKTLYLTAWIRMMTMMDVWIRRMLSH